MTCDPSVVNRATDPHHIDFILDLAEQTLKVIFIAQVKKKFGLRGWLNSHDNGSFMTIKQKFSNLKVSLLDGRMVKLLRDSIKRIEEKEDGFYLGCIKLSLVRFTWRIVCIKFSSYDVA